MASKRKKRFIYVLMFDDEYSREKGVPQFAFYKKPTMGQLVNYLGSGVEDAGDVQALFISAAVWFSKVSIE